jgi:hypothetical protein
VHGKSRWYKQRFTRVNQRFTLYASAQIHSCGTIGGMFGQWDFLTQPRINDF